MADIIDMADFSTEATDPLAEKLEAQRMSAGIQANPIHPPAIITFKTPEEGPRYTNRFETETLESVHYDRIGLYATGKYDGSDETVSTLFLWKDVARVQFKFDEQDRLLSETGEELNIDSDGDVVEAPSE